MMTISDLEWYAVRRLGLVWPSVEKLHDKLPRWLSRLQDYGFTAMPRYPYTDWSPASVALFDNVMALLLKQETKLDPQGAHALRNLISIPGRPFKP